MTEFTLRDSSPDDLEDQTITICGCGTLMSRFARHIAHWNAPRIRLIDFDIVERKNVLGHSSQVYGDRHIGRPKVEALSEILTEINPSIQIESCNCKIENVEKFSGIVCAGLDQYDGRVAVRDSCLQGPEVSLLIEGRLDATEGRVFHVDPRNLLHQDRYSDPANWKKWAEPDPLLPACGLTLTSMVVAEIVAVEMFKLLLWSLLQKRGSTRLVANDTVIFTEPELAAHGVVWGFET